MKKLDNVTLFCVDCKFQEKSIMALQKSSEHIKFNKILFITDNIPTEKDDNITYIQIGSINSLIEYSYFMLKELPKYIDTEFCMSVHHDGWIINPDNWRDEFLEYDYIGAPWQNNHPFGNRFRVGNGGVSIRSKKLLNFVGGMNIPKNCGHEDGFICHAHRRHLQSNGVIIAPLGVAKYFAIELVCPDLNVTFKDVLAFHGLAHSEEHINEIKKMETNK